LMKGKFMNRLFISTFLVISFQTSLWASVPSHFYPLMTRAHASGTGVPGMVGSSLTGAYAIKTNGYLMEPGQPYNPNHGPYEFWSMNFGASQSVRKFTLGVDGSGWFNHFDGYSWTSFWDGYGDYADSNVSNAGLGRLVGTSIIYATESDLGRVASGDPNFASGICSAAIGGALRTGSFVLNPAPLTFKGVEYQAQELALVTSIDGAALPTHRKVVLLYDLRQIGEYTDRQPDYNTGQDGLGNQTPVFGAYNQTDWNDCFYPLVTGQMILDTIPGATTAATFNYGRQAVWAPDASAIYVAGFTVNSSYNEADPDDIRYYNGIWKYDFAADALMWIHREGSRDERMYYCEMAVVDTATRDFTNGAETGMQVLYSSSTENVGGISCIVDRRPSDPGAYDPNTFSNPPVYTVVDVETLAAMHGQDVSAYDTRNIVADAAGNLYFYVSGNSLYTNTGKSIQRGPHALYKYDLQGRLYAVSNRAIHMNFHQANGISVNGSTGAMGAFQYYPNLFGQEMITFRSSPLRVPCGLHLYAPLDFNQDGQVDHADLVLFRDQRIASDSYLDPFYSGKMADPNAMPSIFDISAEHLACDINGNSSYRSVLVYKQTGQRVPPEVMETLDLGNLDKTVYSVEENKNYFNEKIVTEEDTAVLYQFVIPGDANLDGIVELQDFAALSAHFGTGNATDDRKDYSQGDFDFDGDVDMDDLYLLSAFWLSSRTAELE
jgi:hypothetical protein